MIDDSLENTFNVDSLVFEVLDSPSVSTGTVVKGVIEERIRTIEVAEHFKDLVDNFADSGGGSIDLNSQRFTN